MIEFYAISKENCYYCEQLDDLLATELKNLKVDVVKFDDEFFKDSKFINFLKNLFPQAHTFPIVYYFKGDNKELKYFGGYYELLEYAKERKSPSIPL